MESLKELFSRVWREDIELGNTWDCLLGPGIRQHYFGQGYEEVSIEMDNIFEEGEL